MALQLPPHRAYAANAGSMVVQVIQVTLSMSAPIKILKTIGIHSNDLPTAWLSISHDQEHYFTQLAVILDNGSCLSCDDLVQFANSPNGPAIFGTDGDLALYVTHIKKASGDLSQQTSIIDEYHGDRMTYIPSDKIARITFRKKRNPKKGTD